MIAATFKPGDRVRLARVKHPTYRGKTGTVRRCYKTKETILIDVDGINPKLTTSVYEAFPANLEPLN